MFEFVSSASGAFTPSVETNIAAATIKSVRCVFTLDTLRASATRLQNIAPWPDSFKTGCPGAILNSILRFPQTGIIRFQHLSHSLPSGQENDGHQHPRQMFRCLSS